MRYKLVKINALRVCDSRPKDTRIITQASDAKETLVSFFASSQDDQERLVVLALDNKNQVMGLNVVHIGGQNSSLVDMAVLFRHVLLAGGRAFIVAHNHPGGDPMPSQEDRNICQAIKLASLTLQVSFLDFIIVGDESNDLYSFHEAGLI